MAQFKTGLSRFIKRLSLKINLNLLDCAAAICKISKFIVQLHCNRLSDIANCLKNVKKSAISDHQCNWTIKVDNFHVLAA